MLLTAPTAPLCVKGFTRGDAALKGVPWGEAGSCAVWPHLCRDCGKTPRQGGCHHTREAAQSHLRTLGPVVHLIF